MTILQNAYNAYLTKKYEKEINEFKEGVNKEIEIRIKENEAKILYEIYHIASNLSTISNLKNKINLLKELKKDLNNPLTINIDDFIGLGLEVSVNNYERLNEVIVKGESKFIVFKQTDSNNLAEGKIENYKWDVPSNVEVNYDFVNNKIQIEDIANKLIDAYKKYVQQCAEEAVNQDNERHEKCIKLLDKQFEEAKKNIDKRLNEIDDQNKCHIAITVNGCNTSASQFAAEFVEKIKKNKGGLI
ncbi:hypothetical protein [Lysinibacillus sp. BPa_S21]|uniref:hypothetical protein n=1 Tax=Lysinibacillus sp. BPa_S21 TaxID=2932478 RepID=UPI002010DA3E|nr:hypothetical protein [Lysinibacillus sp. BPa_S21]MCL1696410.1 hypothetical protein [Lysinibacillus sp. BPa_S21]